MHLAHSQIKPLYWCEDCHCALNENEVDEVRTLLAQGVKGATTLVTTECGACGAECEDYNFQDEGDDDVQ